MRPSIPADLADDPIAAVAAHRAQVAAQPDPVRFAILEALARRAAAAQGEARRLLVRRVEHLLAEHTAAHPAQAQASPTADEHPAPLGALAGLTALIDRLGRSPAQGRATTPASPSAPPSPLKAVAEFKGTWSRLRAEQGLRQALAHVPAKAGPLNSSQVVSRALHEMHGLSPAYLDAFLSHAHTLLWLEQASGGGDLSPRIGARTERERRGGGRAVRRG